MFDHAVDPSAVLVSPTTDNDLFRSITGRDLRSTSRFRNADSKSLHEGQRRQFERMPDLADACEHLASLVKAEKREDHKLSLKDLQVDSFGALVAPVHGEIIPGVESMEMMERAWTQLIGRAPRHVPAGLRGNVNSWLRDCNGTAVARTMEAPSGKARQCYALVSERFQPHDADRVADEVAKAMPSECKGAIKYMGDGGLFSVDCILARPFEVEGDGVHRVIINVRSADDGTASQRITFKAWRLKCLNGMFIADSHLMRRVWHKGNAHRLREQFAEGLVMARDAIESFSAHWRRAQHEKFVDAQSGADLSGPEALRRLVGRGDIVVPHVRPATLVDSLRSAWSIEPGDSVASVLNAVTRAAHENAWKATWTTEHLEQVAGELLYGHALGLPALTTKQAEALAA